MALVIATKFADEAAPGAGAVLQPLAALRRISAVMRRTRQEAGISQGLWGVDTEGTERMVVPCRSPSIRSPATGCGTARTARQERRLRKSYRERWEDEFRPENLNKTTIKFLVVTAMFLVATYIFGWDRYAWPMFIILIYYFIIISLVKIRMRRS